MSAAPVDGSQIQVSVHPTSRTNGSWPGNASAPAIVYSIANASTAKQTPMPANSHPMALSGWRRRITAPMDPVVTAAS